MDDSDNQGVAIPYAVDNSIAIDGEFAHRFIIEFRHLTANVWKISQGSCLIDDFLQNNASVRG